jgi:preprotein translocase subunit SecE
LGVQVPPALQDAFYAGCTTSSTSTANLTVRVDVLREVRHVVDEKHDTEAGKEKLGLFGSINLFYRQVVAELRKVVWPTKKQLTTYTAVVFVFVGFIIAVVSILDVALTKIVFWIFG